MRVVMSLDVEAEARSLELLVLAVAPVVLVEPAPAAPVVPVLLCCEVVSLAIEVLLSVLVPGFVVESVAVALCCDEVSLAMAPLCCEVVSLLEVEPVLATEPLAEPVAPNEPEVLSLCFVAALPLWFWVEVVSLATEELRSVLVALVSGDVEAVELLELGWEAELEE